MPNITDNHNYKNPKSAIRAYLGGSFDPVHEGHVQMAMAVYERLLSIAQEQQRDLQVSLLPNARSPFKAHSTDPAHRLAMLKLAIQGTPLQIDELELWQTPPVYTIDSVRALRQRYPHDSLIFIMGMDSARSLEQWKEGLALKDYVNLWVFGRVGMSGNRSDLYKTSDALTDKIVIKQEGVVREAVAQEIVVQKPIMQEAAALPASLKPLIVDTPADLITPPIQNLAKHNDLKNVYQGHIYIDYRPVIAVSSTQIRQQLGQTTIQTDITCQAGTQINAIMPINDIMSHTIPNPFAKWLNPAVYHYIIAHQLYSVA